MAQDKKKDVAIGYGLLALMYVTIALVALSFADLNDWQALRTYMEHLAPTLVPLLGLVVVNATIAGAVLRIARLGRAAKTTLAFAAVGLAVFAVFGAWRGLLAWHAGILPEFANLNPLVGIAGACIYSFLAIGVVRLIKGSNTALQPTAESGG